MSSREAEEPATQGIYLLEKHNAEYIITEIS